MNKINLYILSIIFIISSSVYLLPNHHQPWSTAYQDFLTYMVFLILILKITINYKIILIDWKIALFFLMSFIPLIQYIFGKIFFFGDALIAFIYIFSFGCIMCVGYNFSKNIKIEKIMLFMCSIFIFASFISIYFILSQWLLISDINYWIEQVDIGRRPYANFSQPNNCSTFFLIGLMALLYTYEKKYISKFSSIILSCLILFGVALTQSRTAWVFFLCFIIWWNWKYKIIQPRTRRNVPLYFSGLFIIFTISIPIISKLLGVLSTSNLVERTSSGFLRLPMWNQMILAIMKEPMWGYGWNQVSVAQMSIFLDYPTTEWIEHTHNIILDLFIWNGIPIATLIIVCIVLWFYYLNKITNSVDAFFALAIVGAVLVHGMLEFPLEYGFFLLPVGFLLGLVQSTDDKKEYIEINRNILYLIMPLMLIFYVWIFVEYKILENDTSLLRYETLNIGNVYADNASPNVYLLTQLRERNRFSRTMPTQYMSQVEIQWMKMVAQRYATASNLYRYSQALALNGYPEQAKKNLFIIEKLYGRKYSIESLYFEKESLAFKWKQQGISNP